MSLSADSLKFLDEAKKGKTRRFVMIMKGEKILSMVIYKKGSVEKYKKEAKEDGKGQFYFGVIEGKGQQLVFKLSSEDGFDKIPGKDIKLKTFLNEASGFAFKPSYEIVAALPPETGDDVEPESTGRAPVDSTGATEASTTDSASTTTAPETDDPNVQAEFMAKLKSLKPDIDQLSANPSPQGQLVKQLTGEMAVAARGKEFATALDKLSQIEDLLSQDAPSDAAAVRWQQRHAEIEPRYLAFLKTDDPNAGKLRAVMAFAVDQADEGNFDKAIAALDRMEPHLVIDTGTSRTPPALEKWQTQRGAVVNTLHDLARAIAAAKDPEAKEAIILIKAIAANLTEKPTTQQSVAELERYLNTDSILEEAESENGFGINVKIREPLLSVLAELKQELPA